MVTSYEKYKFELEKNYYEWCKVGPWFNNSIFTNLQGYIFEDYFVTACKGRYYLMCGLYAYDKKI